MCVRVCTAENLNEYYGTVCSHGSLVVLFVATGAAVSCTVTLAIFQGSEVKGQ